MILNRKSLLLILMLILLPLILSGCDLIKKSSSGSDGGIFKTTDFGSNWKQKIYISQFEDSTRTIGNVDTNFIIFDPVDEETIYLVTQGNGIYKTTNSAEQWYQTSLNAGTYQSLSIDTRNNDVAYVTDGRSISKTINNFSTWNQIYIENRPTQSILTVIADYYNPSIIYAATSSGIIKSFDYGSTWQLLNWTGLSIRTLYQSNINSNVLFVLTNDGIYKSIDGANNWEKISEGLTSFTGGQNISWMFFDPRTEYIILGTDYGIIRSLNSGLTWETIPTLFEFNKITIKPVVYNPNNPNEYIFAVGNVIHKSDDGGNTWKTIKSIPTTRIVNYIIADPYHDDVIFAGTYLPKKK
ncbi:MAG: hypothetical protein Q8P20_02255 [bacterium]|nr:hypothetical protein [bacterium]